MADNVELDAGSGGATMATDEISSAHYQKMLIGYGADGTWTRVTASAGFPVQLQTGHADIKVTLDGETVTLGGDLPDTAAGDLAAMVVDLAAIEVLLGTETSTANEDLNLILSAAQDVIWTITYIEVA